MATLRSPAKSKTFIGLHLSLFVLHVKSHQNQRGFRNRNKANIRLRAKLFVVTWMIWDGFLKDPKEKLPTWRPAWIQSSRGYFGHWQTTRCSCLERIAACMDWTRETPPPMSPGFRCDNAVEMQHYLQSFWQVGETQNYIFVSTQKGWNSYTKMSISHLQNAKGINRIPPTFSLSAAFDHLAVQLIGSRRWHIRLVISETITTGTEAHMLRFGDPGDMVTWWLSREGVT